MSILNKYLHFVKENKNLFYFWRKTPTKAEPNISLVVVEPRGWEELGSWSQWEREYCGATRLELPTILLLRKTELETAGEHQSALFSPAG